MEQIIKAITEKQNELHIHQFAFTTTDQLVFSQGVRDLCEQNSCGHYGRTWACPPGVGTTEECKARIMKFKNVFVFTTKHDLEDSYDFEGMMAGKDRHDVNAQEHGLAHRSPSAQAANHIRPAKEQNDILHHDHQDKGQKIGGVHLLVFPHTVARQTGIKAESHACSPPVVISVSVSAIRW